MSVLPLRGAGLPSQHSLHLYQVEGAACPCSPTATEEAQTMLPLGSGPHGVLHVIIMLSGLHNKCCPGAT